MWHDVIDSIYTVITVLIDSTQSGHRTAAVITPSDHVCVLAWLAPKRLEEPIACILKQRMLNDGGT
jgi:hypothetical protein